MISTDTPIGTEIVCINDDTNAFAIPGFSYCGDLDGLKRGEIYTVAGFCNAFDANEISVLLREIERPLAFDMPQGFHRARFRRLNLGGLEAHFTSTAKLKDMEPV
jgi:hypothetical protein